MGPTFTVEVRAPGGEGLIDEDIGRRLRGLRFSTALNKGFDGLTAQLNGTQGGLRGDRVLFPVAEVEALWYAWALGLIYVYAGGTLAWMGRLWTFSWGGLIRDPDLGLCFTDVTLQAHGIWRDLAADRFPLPGSFVTPDRTLSASDYARLVPERHAPIGPPTAELLNASTNVGPTRANSQSSLYDYIVDALRVTGPDGVRYTFLLYEPRRGPIIKPIDLLPASWTIPLEGSGLVLKRDMEQYATEVEATSTEGTTGASKVFNVFAPDTVKRTYQGFEQKIVVAGTGGGVEGAEALTRTELALRMNPVALDGSATFEGEVYGAGGEVHPAWEIRAGDGAYVDAAGLEFVMGAWFPVVDHTEYDADSDTVTVALDRQRVHPPRRSNPVYLVDAARMVEGSAANPHAPLRITDTAAVQLAVEFIVYLWNRGYHQFRVQESRVYQITLTATFKETSTDYNTHVYLGALFDGENDGDWDTSNPAHATPGFLNPGSGVNGAAITVTHRREMFFDHTLTHTVVVLMQDDRTSVGGIVVDVTPPTLEIL